MMRVFSVYFSIYELGKNCICGSQQVQELYISFYMTGVTKCIRMAKFG